MTPATVAGRALLNTIAPEPGPEAEELRARSARGRRARYAEAVVAVERAALEEARTEMYGLIAARVAHDIPGDWMQFEDEVNSFFDRLLAGSAT